MCEKRNLKGLPKKDMAVRSIILAGYEFGRIKFTGRNVNHVVKMVVVILRTADCTNVLHEASSFVDDDYIRKPRSYP